MATFPPTLDVGNRVWTEAGYLNHGPSDGPKCDIAPKQGGTITNHEYPYSTIDNLLYTVRWDSGQSTKHYAEKLFCIGKFQDFTDFQAAIKLTGEITKTEGPMGGFREAWLVLEYDGEAQTAKVDNRDLWLKCIEPLVKTSNATVKTIRLRKSGQN